ncbi:MAG: DUF1553 domain-containing protein [Isosphaeraceae bacterium]|nr:DUF1553 domain-containing protein [Isosphaeraceae bacterium]
MSRPARALFVLAIAPLLCGTAATAAEPLHDRIDALIQARADGRSASPLADDAEFLRRVYLDLAGRIPSVEETRAFLADPSPEKRPALIDRLLSGPDYPRRMAELFHVILMERLGDHPAWTRYLRASFAANKPWDQMAREILRADPDDEAHRGAAFFLAKRLEHYGENPIDYPGLAADVGRMFLGIDLRCAQCHDHIFIDDYKQRDFQGLFAFIQNTFLQDPKGPTVGEKPTTQKLSYTSVFTRKASETGPRLPGGEEVPIPSIPKGDEYRKPPDRKAGFPGRLRFSPLAELAERLPVPENRAFVRNSVNRLWQALMGRGLVHPPDQHHADNPPSHPELLDLLADEFVAHRFDIQWLLRELALSRTYQRSSLLPEDGEPPPPESFLTAIEKRLSAEQLLRSMLEATGQHDLASAEEGPEFEALRAKFLKAFANPPREPEDEFNPSLRSALFVLNDETVLGWLAPRPGNLIDRLAKQGDDRKVAEVLYLAVLTRPPTSEEQEEVASYLARNAERRAVALGHLAWALLTSTEFCINH